MIPHLSVHFQLWKVLWNLRLLKFLICGCSCLRSQFHFFDWNRVFFFTVFIFMNSKYEIYFIIYAFSHCYKFSVFQKLPCYDQKQTRVYISVILQMHELSHYPTVVKVKCPQNVVRAKWNNYQHKTNITRFWFCVEC